ncbi:hypothetical protein MXD62_37520 [Frankia sp. Mgl5]|uniref:hypothetical protein n=1 Tax=Frankia sp. Mgl5 TaxID=2933793 RepID=UPI00200F7443|nr:hypothetical protein [Frankia sp. Mgl5]MCK9932776.1 hypothetical protein [Frankia sp. Mgl5]
MYQTCDGDNQNPQGGPGWVWVANPGDPAGGAPADVVKQMKALIVTAPEPVRAELSTPTTGRLITVCVDAEVPSAGAGDPAVAVRLALRSLARRFHHLSSEIKDLGQDPQFSGCRNRSEAARRERCRR